MRYGGYKKMLSFIKKVLSIIRCRIDIATDIRLKAKYSLKKIMSVIRVVKNGISRV